jgi:Cu-Zn family superoxide dismutase
LEKLDLFLVHLHLEIFMNLRVTGAAAIALSIGLVACSTPKPPLAPRAATHLSARSNTKVSGTVEFKQVGDQVEVKVVATNLSRNQEHGFHIHEKGDCNSPDGMSAGGHFNPTNKPHGPHDADHHLGDMPALKADANGRAEASFVLKGVTLTEGPASITGRAVIVHRDPDDYKTQPTGNSGARIACGVIDRL